MNFIKNLLPALAGSLALNAIHEIARRKSDNVPKINKIAEEGIEKIWEATGNDAPTGNKRYRIALTGDIVANTAYFTAIKGRTNTETWVKGLVLGAVAGFGALKLTAPIGLNDQPVNRNPTVQALTILYYAAGGLVTAAVFNSLRKYRKK